MTVYPLPIEILVNTFSFLHPTPEELASLSKVCKVFNEAAKENSLWKENIQRDFPFYQMPTEVVDSSKALYKKICTRIVTKLLEHKDMQAQFDHLSDNSKLFSDALICHLMPPEVPLTKKVQAIQAYFHSQNRSNYSLHLTIDTIRDHAIEIIYNFGTSYDVKIHQAPLYFGHTYIDYYWVRASEKLEISIQLETVKA